MIDWKKLELAAWEARENASILGNTKVGAALLTENGKIYSGCNIEQLYRNKDIHAEVCAISKMISSGDKNFIAILVVAEREKFTPCGTCMDWIFQFGGINTKVAYQNIKNGETFIFSANELMPHYPR
jgi:cytidine deaminase